MLECWGVFSPSLHHSITPFPCSIAPSLHHSITPARPVKFLPLIWSNLRRRKLRTLLTVLSILVAFVLFGALSSIQQALTGGVQMAGADRLVVRHKVSIIQLLPESYKARMERIPGVVLATHQTWFGGIYQDPKNFFMQCPVVPEEFLDIHPEIVVSPEQKKAWLQTRTGAVVGRKTADKFHWKIGDKVPIRSTIWAQGDGNRTWAFDIVGIYDGRDKGTDTTALFFRYDYFEEARGARPKGRSAGTPSASKTPRGRRIRRNWWTRNLKTPTPKPKRSRKAPSCRGGRAPSATST